MAFTKLLVANRGEIACRVIRSAHALGYRTVAMASEADATAPHMALADEAVVIGPAEASRSYLCIEAVLAAATRTGADAVHPGYGFLAENADFAEACAARGLVFVGPPAEAIRLMGNKRLAKLRMLEADVPCIPGYSGPAQDDATLTREAKAIGFPVMVKAAAGGGGRGLRLVATADDLAEALAGARSESLSVFGSDELILERALSGARHVEVQVFADSHGNVVNLGERDCSVQRRHQKVIEEAPSPAVDPALRQAMGEAAVTAARAVGYRGAGTVEYLLDAKGAFHFLEMNTRLQVEHPVTEAVTGQDLVAWQLRIAAGEPLPLGQDQIALVGHAIEARLYAENPARGYLPETGRILHWRPPSGEDVRVDAGIAEGDEITAFYDPMLAKLIAHGPDRETARRRLVRALESTEILGLASNRRFLLHTLEHEGFKAGTATTDFLDEAASVYGEDPPPLTLAASLIYERSATGDGWRNSAPAETVLHLRHGEALRAVTLHQRAGRVYDVDDETVRILDATEGRVRYEIGGIRRDAVFAFDGDMLHLDGTRIVEEPPYLARKRAAAGSGQLLAPMAGRVVDVRAAPGGAVRRGDILVVLEAMKMEHEIRAALDGTVTEVRVKAGEQVAARQLLAAVEAATGD